MYRIAKKFTFAASHQIPSLPPEHCCARLHGHTYTIEVEMKSAQLDRVGFVRDYGDLLALKKYIDETFDHRHLNDILGDEKTTTEYIARHFYDWCQSRWPETSAVRVSEGSDSWAEYRHE